MKLIGPHTKGEAYILPEVQEASETQGRSVQEGKRQQSDSRKEKVRHEAAGLWRSDQTHLQEEGKDYQKGYPET